MPLKDKFKAKSGHFPLLQLRLRGPLHLVGIIRMAKNKNEFFELLFHHFSKRNIQRIAVRSHLQSESIFWYIYRRSVVTSTLAKRIIAQNLRNINNPKINKIISKFYQTRYSNVAMQYGIENEKHGLNTFFETFKKTHINAKLQTTGLVLYNLRPFIGASPDGLLSCDCCQNAIKEIKCPYRLKDAGIDSWSILEYFDPLQNLKKSHTYFNQINLTQGILRRQVAYFVVYAKNEIIVKRIDFDKEFFDHQILNISQYYEKFYLPEVLGKKI